jgi:DNA invertase Pin-like site-specific DNA recombinase
VAAHSRSEVLAGRAGLAVRKRQGVEVVDRVGGLAAKDAAVIAQEEDARHLFEDHASGARSDRPGLTRALDFVCPGDVLVVWKLDRLGRSLSHLLAIVNSLKDKQVAFRSLTEGMDTTKASGELLFHVFGALAQYERALAQERVVAGLAAAKRRGRVGGRPRAIVGEKLDAIIAALDGGMSKAAVCRNFGVKRTTLIETLARVGWPSPTETPQQ